MTADDGERSARRSRRRAVVRYVVAWAAGGALVAVLLVALLGGQDDESVSLPPVRQTALADAARSAGCELRGPARRAGSNPPVDGSPGVATRPGTYDRPPAIASLVGAVRRGIIVIHYRPGLDETRVDQLRKLQPAVPAGTIVAPNASGMRYEVAATAYRRLLGCPRFTDQAIDALRLFRGRYLGVGTGSPTLKVTGSPTWKHDEPMPARPRQAIHRAGIMVGTFVVATSQCCRWSRGSRPSAGSVGDMVPKADGLRWSLPGAGTSRKRSDSDSGPPFFAPGGG